jgi:iron(III) transport system permease protein
MALVSTQPVEKTRARFARRIDSPSAIAALALVVVLLLCVGPPLWFLVQGSLRLTTPTGAMGAFTLAYYRRLFADPKLFEALRNSTVFALGSAALAIVLGGFMAWLVERTNAPLKAFAWMTAIISLGTPYILYVTAWLFLLGRSGPLNEWLASLTPDHHVQFNVYSMLGMVLIEGFLWSPMAFLLLSSVFRASNADYEDSARMCGASAWRVLSRISFRLAAPAFAAIALLVVVRAIESFEVPALVGLPGGVNVLTTNIYLDLKQQTPPDFGYSSAFSVVLLVIAGALLSFYSRLSANASRYHTITGRGFRPRPFDLGGLRWVGGVVIAVNFTVLLAIPTGALLWLSLLPFSQGFSWRGLRLLTGANYATVLHSTFYLDLVWKTFVMSAGAASAAMALMAIAAWLSVRRKPGGWLLDQLASAPLVFPGIVLGVAMIQVFLAAPFPIYGTLAAFVVAYMIRFLPYGMRYAAAGVIQIHPQLEESAVLCGASWARVLTRVVLPLAAPSILSGWLFIFLIVARDLSMAVILASPSAQPVAVAMLDLWSNGQGTELAAFGLAWTLIMTIVASGFFFIGARSSRSTFSV